MIEIPTTTAIFTIGFLMATQNGVLGGMFPSVGEKHSNVQGTYWQGSTFAGSCLLQDYQSTSSLHYVAVANDLNRDGKYCGACIKITPLATSLPPVVAIVSTYCADCPAGALDMEGSLYDSLMTNKPGRPGVSKFNWEVTPCPLGNKRPAIVNKSGSSKYHLSMLIADSKFPVASVVISSGGRDYQAIHKDYNYWELSSSPALGNTVDVKVTCTNGGSFSVKGVDPSSRSPTLAQGSC